MTLTPDEFAFDSTQFSGLVRLFPLPNLVMFPHVLQPLHVFEPRYRDLLAEALQGDRLITMALLAPGWENDYEGRPPLYPVGCLGRIAACHRLDDGRYNLLLVGLKRVGLLKEVEPIKTFREARAQLYDDHYPPGGAGKRSLIQQRLLGDFQRILPRLPEAQEPLQELLAGEIPLGMLTDIVAYTLDLDLSAKQRLLRECNVDRRATLLLEWLPELARARRESAPSFPPRFSAN